MTDPIRIAIVGYWHVHARDYAADAAANPDTEVVAVWDDDLARGRAGADSLGVPFEPDLGALLARADIDAVVVTTSTDQHRDVMVRAAQAGKHIYTEKVLAPTVAEAEEIVAAADAAGVRLFVSLPRLYAGYTAALAEIVDAGTLGQLVYGRVRLSHDGAVSIAADRAGCPSGSSTRRPPSAAP